MSGSGPRPLTGPQAARTLAHRLTPVADRLRQLNTRFGLRSKRVFLTWTYWTGQERGEGREDILARVELLPTPRVTDLNSLTRRPYSAGVFPEGTLRVDQISAGAFTTEMLQGRVIPLDNVTDGCVCQLVPPDGKAVRRIGVELFTDRHVDFFYEVVEDGRGGDEPTIRRRMRLYGAPNRKEDALYFEVNLERASEDMGRDGQSQVDEEEVDE